MNQYNDFTTLILDVDRPPIFSEIVTVAQKCVPDPKVDPEIEALLSMIDKQSKAMSALKSAVGQLYKDGKLNPLTSTKFEVCSQFCGNQTIVWQ